MNNDNQQGLVLRKNIIKKHVNSELPSIEVEGGKSNAKR